jgi:hypothetical protein
VPYSLLIAAYGMRKTDRISDLPVLASDDLSQIRPRFLRMTVNRTRVLRCGFSCQSNYSPATQQLLVEVRILFLMQPRNLLYRAIFSATALRITS